MADELAPCPHCGAKARVEASGALRWRCGVCGGPLVPTDASVPRSNGELPHLVRSQRTRAMALGWTAAAFVLGAVGMMAAGVGLLVWMASHGAAIVVGAIALAAFVATMGSLRRARTRRVEARAQLDEAWDHVAAEVLRARHGEMTATELAAAMQTDAVHAEHLLSKLSVEGRVRVDVRDDADLAYRVEEEAAAAPDEPDAPAPAPGTRARS
jgi:type IV secretory pathway TrbD component